MKGSFIIIGFFTFGIITGLYDLLPLMFIGADVSVYALYTLMFLVGIGVGSDKKSWEMLRSVKLKIIMIPLAIIVGTFLGVSIISIFIDIGLRESLAIGAGFGYYSLSAIFITNISGETLGVIALIANIFREVITLLLTPLLVKYVDKLAPIASGGATSMDTTLPIIIKFSGKEYGIISIFSGIVLTILVPFFITFILK